MSKTLIQAALNLYDNGHLTDKQCFNIINFLTSKLHNNYLKGYLPITSKADNRLVANKWRADIIQFLTTLEDEDPPPGVDLDNPIESQALLLEFLSSKTVELAKVNRELSFSHRKLKAAYRILLHEYFIVFSTLEMCKSMISSYLKDLLMVNLQGDYLSQISIILGRLKALTTIKVRSKLV